MSSELTIIKKYLENVDVKKRFNDILGERAGAFMASIVNTCGNNNSLIHCDPASIMNSAFIAATLDLPIDTNLGFAAIVPYKDKAQFQIMYKGFIQLAIRSGQYAGMNVSEVYDDEISEYNPITGELLFTNFRECKQRNEGDESHIAGYYAWFKLTNGFSKYMYMNIHEIRNHAKKYSKSYGYDIAQSKKSSKWTTDFDVMAKKTVIKLLLSKWGVLSVDMQKAIKFDQSSVSPDVEPDYVDNQPEMTVPVSSLDQGETNEVN